MKRVLITGASGFIGSHLIDHFLGLGIEVLALDRTGLASDNPSVILVKGDIMDPILMNNLTAEVDGVIHLAGLLGTAERINNMRDSIRVNINGALNVHDAIALHGKPGVQITVGNFTWLNTYAITKYATERIALMSNKERGTKIAVVRGLNVYGPRQKHAPIRKVVPNFIVRALQGEDVEIYGNGEQLLDLIHVQDCADILFRALAFNHRRYDDVIDAGTGQLYTVNFLASEIIRLCESESKVVHLPMRPGEPENSITKGDPTTLKCLGWNQEFISLEEGLRSTIKWYKDFYPSGL